MARLVEPRARIGLARHFRKLRGQAIRSRAKRPAPDAGEILVLADGIARHHEMRGRIGFQIAFGDVAEPDRKAAENQDGQGDGDEIFPRDPIAASPVWTRGGFAGYPARSGYSLKGFQSKMFGAFYCFVAHLSATVESMPQAEPLIVGAGPVGLAAAVFLARQGVRARIIDSAAQQATNSRALAVNPRTMEILESSGITAKMLEMGKKILGGCILWRKRQK